MLRTNLFYQDENLTLYCSNALELLKDFDTESVDFIFTDPPYMISQNTTIKRGGNSRFNGKDINLNFGEWDNYWKTTEEYIEWNKVWLKEAYRVLKRFRHIVFFFDLKKMAHVYDYLEELGGVSRNPIFWIKSNPAPLARKVTFMSAVEGCVWVTKEKVLSQYFSYENGYHTNYFISSIPQNSKKEFGRIHPTQKPIDFAKFVIQYLSKPGDIILDPFVGSGTFIIASVLLGRKAIGIEIKDEFCHKIIERYKNVLKSHKKGE